MNSGGAAVSNAEMKMLMSILCAVVGGALLHAAAPMPEKADLLASNAVVAEYVETKDQPCHFRTALCPDRCNHATRLAYFKVLENTRYERAGQYGDDKLEPGSMAAIDVQKDVPGQSPALAAAVAQLKPGDKVRMTISHYYVQTPQAQYPIRPVTQFEPLSH